MITFSGTLTDSQRYSIAVTKRRRQKGRHDRSDDGSTSSWIRCWHRSTVTYSNDLLKCRVIEPDDFCHDCGTVVRRRPHLPIDWRPTPTHGETSPSL